MNQRPVEPDAECARCWTSEFSDLIGHPIVHRCGVPGTRECIAGGDGQCVAEGDETLDWCDGPIVLDAAAFWRERGITSDEWASAAGRGSLALLLDPYDSLHTLTPSEVYL